MPKVEELLSKMLNDKKVFDDLEKIASEGGK